MVAPKFDIYDNTPMTMPVEYAAIKSALLHLNKYAAAYINDRPLSNQLCQSWRAV